MLFSTTKIKGNYYLNINNNNVEKSGIKFFVGVYIDDNLILERSYFKCMQENCHVHSNFE